MRGYSILDSVFLHWDKVILDDISGYNIYRKKPQEPEFSRLAALAPDVNEYLDAGLEFGVAYQYQVSVFGEGYESARSGTVTLTPGPTFAWTTDNAREELIKLSHDATNEIRRTVNFFDVIDIEPNSNTGDVWVIEQRNRFAGEIVKRSAEGALLARVTDIAAPMDLAVNSAENTVWAVDSVNNVVAKIDGNGRVIFNTPGLVNPFMLAVDAGSGACWVADNGRDKVVRIRSDGSELLELEADFQSVSAIAVNSAEPSLWVADASGLTKFTTDGDPLMTVSSTEQFVSRMAADETTHALWVLSLRLSKLTKYSATGQEEFALTEFAQPNDLAVNFFNNTCLVADTNNDRLVKVSANGVVAAVFENVRFPDAVAIQN